MLMRAGGCDAMVVVYADAKIRVESDRWKMEMLALRCCDACCASEEML
jgi:hypothetical protein